GGSGATASRRRCGLSGRGEAHRIIVRRSGRAGRRGTSPLGPAQPAAPWQVDSVMESGDAAIKSITMREHPPLVPHPLPLPLSLLACLAGALGCGRSGIDDYQPALDAGTFDVSLPDGAIPAPEASADAPVAEAGARCDGRTCPGGCCTP